MKLIESKAELLLQGSGLEGVYKQIETCGRTCYKSSPKVIDHADIVVTHHCNNHCPFCIDKFINTSDDIVSLDSIEKFLNVIKSHSRENTEVLLLGGEPTSVGIEKLKEIATLIKVHGFLPIISTNARNQHLVVELTKYFTWVQVTIHKFEDIEFYAPYKNKINIKLAGDKTLTLDRFNKFIELTKDYERRSISMYFTPDFKELCTDEGVWEILNTLEWKQNGSYLYAFYKGVRIKRCITGKTNIIDEPSVPKLYPNGNYNKTWCNEDNDPYLDISSSKQFVERMIRSNHTAMLEHGTIYLAPQLDHIVRKYQNNPYSRVTEKCDEFRVAVTTNLRVLVENGWLDDLKYLCEPTELPERRYTIKFTTDRGVSHELVRHRVFSFAQESTRYCNYSKDKFGNELTFIKPSWYDEAEENTRVVFDTLLDSSENAYLNLLEHQCSPQQARQVLPNALKTEVCMTGFASDWRFFFDLRYYGETGKPHPDMELLASKAREEFIKAGLWNDILRYPSKFTKND